MLLLLLLLQYCHYMLIDLLLLNPKTSPGHTLWALYRMKLCECVKRDVRRTFELLHPHDGKTTGALERPEGSVHWERSKRYSSSSSRSSSSSSSSSSNSRVRLRQDAAARSTSSRRNPF